MMSRNEDYRRKRRARRMRMPARGPQPRLTDHLGGCDKRNLDRLWGSQNPLDLAQLLMGYLDAYGTQPIFLNRRLYNEHLLSAGSTNAGKSTYLIGQQLQLIEQNRLFLSLGMPASTVIIVDLKPDDSMFNIIREAATRVDDETPALPFKWLDVSRSDTPTFLFNPFEQEFFQNLTPAEQAAFFTQALGMYYGSGYGKEYFGFNLHEGTIRILSKDKPTSFRDLVEYALRTPKEMAKYLSLSERDFDAMRHLTLQLGYLARRPEMTPSEANPLGLPRSVIAQRIDFGKSLQPGNEQVIYLRLNSTMDKRTARLTASLAVASLVFAAQYYSQTNRAQMFLDEAHVLADEDNLPDWLAKCRGAGVSLTLATQTLAQFPPQTVQLIINSTNFKTFFSSPDPVQLKVVQHLSGTKFEDRMSFGESATYTPSLLPSFSFRIPDAMGKHSAQDGPDLGGFSLSSLSFSESVSQVEVPGLRDNDIFQNNYHRSQAIFAITSEVDGSYYQPLDGRARPFYRSYPMSEERHRAFENLKVPNDEGTYVPSDYPQLMADPVLLGASKTDTKTLPAKHTGKKSTKAKRRKTQDNEFADLRDRLKQKHSE